jgi:hypothetical protein
MAYVQMMIITVVRTTYSTSYNAAYVIIDALVEYISQNQFSFARMDTATSCPF